MLFSFIATLTFGLFMVLFAMEEKNSALYTPLAEALEVAGVKFKKRDVKLITSTFDILSYAALLCPAIACIVGHGDLKKDRRNGWGPGSPDLTVSPDILVSRWYVRAQVSMEQAHQVCGEVQPLARSGSPAGEAAFITQPMTAPQVKECLKDIAVDSLFRVLD